MVVVVAVIIIGQVSDIIDRRTINLMRMIIADILLGKEKKEYDLRQLDLTLRAIDFYKKNQVSLKDLVFSLGAAHSLHCVNENWQESFDRYLGNLDELEDLIAYEYSERRRKEYMPTADEQQEINVVVDAILRLVKSAYNQLQLESMLELIDLYKEGLLPLFELSYELENLFKGLYDIDLQQIEAFKAKMIFLDKICVQIVDENRELPSSAVCDQIKPLVDQVVTLIRELQNDFSKLDEI